MTSLWNTYAISLVWFRLAEAAVVSRMSLGQPIPQDVRFTVYS